MPHEHLYIDNQEKFLYGSDSLQSLFEYFSTQRVDVNNCTIQTYNIPEKKIIKLGKGQVKFLKTDIE